MLLFFVLVCFLGACGLEQYPSGDLPTRARLDAIRTGDTRDKVLRILGTPATESITLSSGNSFLIYAQNLKSSRVFMDPAEVKRDVYVYYFNPQGTLAEQQHLTLSDRDLIAYDSATTDVGGKQLSLWEQLIQNFGRYNTGSSDSSVRR